MKLLCSVSNLGYLVSLKIALDAEGIETYVSDADRVMGGIAGPMGTVGRLYLIDEDDFEAAHEVVRSLEPTGAVGTGPSDTIKRKPISPWIIISGITIFAVLFGLVLANST